MSVKDLIRRAKEFGPVHTAGHLSRKYAIELGFTAIAYLLLYKVFELEGLKALLGGIRHHAIVLLLAVILGRVAGLLPIWTEIGLLVEQHRKTPASVRAPVKLFMAHRITDLGTLRQSLLGRDGITLDRNELEQFVDACFTANTGRRYVGTDSHVPTEFYSLYRTYLDEQREASSGRGSTFNLRVLFATEAELVEDHRKDAAIFEEFVDRHLRERVHLLQVDKSIAESLALIQQFPSTDIGIYGWRFVAFYKPVRRDSRLRYRVHLRSIDESLQKQLGEYLTMLNKHARELHVQNHRVECRIPTDNAARDYFETMMAGKIG